jgi:hypothetical protein
MDGCSHCATLEGLISNAGLTSQVSFVYSDPGCGFNSTPGTKTAAGCYGFPSCDEQCQFAAIQTATSSGKSAPTATPAKPVTTTTTAATATKVVDNNPPWKKLKWSNTLTINWGGKNAPPVIAETPVGWTPPDISLTPVLPLPPVMQTGVTVALRDHRRMPKGRKVA